MQYNIDAALKRGDQLDEIEDKAGVEHIYVTPK